MKIRIILIGLLLMLCSSVLIGFHGVLAQTLSITYESGLFLADPNDYIKVSLANVSSNAHNFRVVVFGTINGAPLTTVLDTGIVPIASMSGGKGEYFVPSDVGGNDYGVEIQTDGPKVIPSISVFSNCPNNSCPAGVGPRLWLAGSQLTTIGQ